MALALLQKVAEKALGTVGTAANSAFNYLSKNAPQVIDKALYTNPTTRFISQQGQREVADVGRFLQKMPDTTVRAPDREAMTPEFIKKTPAKVLFDNPVIRAQDKVGEFVSGIPGEFVRSWGRTTERVATPEGREQIVGGVKALPSQTKKIFTPGQRMEGVSELVENPAIEDALNLTDLFTLGAGTALKAAGKEGVEQTVKQVAKKGAKTLTKELIEEGAETTAKQAGKTLVREASEKTPTLLKKGAKIVEEAVTPVADDAVRAANAASNAAPSGTAKFFQKPQDIAARWVNTREGFTNWRAGDIKKSPILTAFDNEGMDAIIDLQSGKNKLRYKGVQEFTDGLFELEKKAGLLEPNQYRKNYLPQLWDNTPEQIDAVFKKTVGKKAGFTKQRLLADYKTGIEAGLTPRFNRVSDLLEARFKTSQRALADKEFIDNLVSSGNAKTLDKAPVGWETVDLTWEGKPIAVPPEVARVVKNYTGEGSALLQKTAEFVSEAKQTVLSAGIPKTGWNFHTGVNIPTRRIAAGKNPLAGVVDSVIWNTNPNSAKHYIEKVVPKDITDGLLKAGLSISRSADDMGYGFKPREGKSAISKARTAFDKLFSEAAFDKVLPAHKLKIGWETYENAIKKGLSQDEAFRIAAETSNTMFGGINTQALGRSKDFQNVLRTFLLAPDWLESNIKIAKGTGGLVNPKNWSKPEYAPFKRFAVNAASMYGSFAMLNKALSGHFPWENGQGQEFNLATGTYDERGRERMIPVFGTAFDFARIPLQLVQAGLEGDLKDMARPLRNRLSPPVSAATSLFVTGEDYRGRPIDSAGEVIGQVAQAVGVPSQVTNIVGGLTGEQTPEEVVAGLLEAPLRYRGGASTPEKRRTAELMKSAGASNEEINQALTYKPEDDGNILTKMFGGGSASGKNIKIPKTKDEKANFDKAVDSALSAGATDLSDDVIITRFFNGKTYDKSARSGQQEILNSMLKVADDEYLSPEQKARIAQAAKIDGVDLEYYRAASMGQVDRLEGLLMYAAEDHPSRDEFIIDLALGKRAVGGKSMFSTDMFDRLYDEGLISKDEKSLLSAIKYDPIFNKFYMDRDYDGGSGASESKVRSYIKSINALHKDVFKPKKSSMPKVEPLPEAPKPQFSKTPKANVSRQSSQARWFTPY